MENGLTLVIKIIFGLYIFIMMLRGLLEFTGAPAGNSIVKLIGQFTDPLVKPFKSFLPSFKGISTAVLVLLLVLKLVEWVLLLVLTGHGVHSVVGLFIISIGDLLRQILNLYFFMILIQAILSWLPTSIQEHPAMEVLNLLVAPALKPIQKFLPTLGGFDFSPLAALIVIQVVKMIIITPFISVGVRMMLL